jgi:hypothetical protein
MSFTLSPRRLLLVLAVAASLGLGLTPPAAARVHASTHPPVAVRAYEGAPLFTSPLALLWNVLHGVWAAVGSSMDPLGNH